MKAFWKWMEEKGFKRLSGVRKEVVLTLVNDINMIGVFNKDGLLYDLGNIPKQMLVGYMIEYIIENDLDWNCLIMEVMCESIQEVYEYLQDYIIRDCEIVEELNK